MARRQSNQYDDNDTSGDNHAAGENDCYHRPVDIDNKHESVSKKYKHWLVLSKQTRNTHRNPLLGSHVELG
jgi:hypothetical protein